MTLNMEGTVTPNHFKVSDFDEFPGLTPAQEFELIAPVAVYYWADSRERPKALTALKALIAHEHPIVEDRTLHELLDACPDGVGNRYNALVMKLVAEVAPGAESYIDSYGAYGFRIGDDSTVAMGDACNFFGWYLSANALQQRVRDALDE